MSGTGQNGVAPSYGYGQMAGGTGGTGFVGKSAQDMGATYGQGANPRTAWQGGESRGGGGTFLGQQGARPNGFGMGGGFVPTPPVENYGNYRGMGVPNAQFNPNFTGSMAQGGSMNGGADPMRGLAKGTNMGMTGGGDPFVGARDFAAPNAYSAPQMSAPPAQRPSDAELAAAGRVTGGAPASFLSTPGTMANTGGPVSGKIGGGPTLPQPIDVSQALANPPSWYPQGQYGPGPGQTELPLSQNPNWRPNPGNVFDFSMFGKPY
jgi:hypothetical protein